MKRSTIIATCLLNSDMVTELEDGEAAVRSVFAKNFSAETFSGWNLEVDERTAEHIVSTVGRAMTINVVRFIEDLRAY